MTRPVVPLLVGLGLVFSFACGRKGALVLPPPRGPMPVEGLEAVPRDGSVLLSWTNPVKDVSGRPLGVIRTVEIWVFDGGLPEGVRGFSDETIERTARLARTIAGPELAAMAAAGGAPPGVLSFAYPLGERPAGAARIAFAVRVRDGRRRASAFAGPVSVELGRRDSGGRPPRLERCILMQGERP